MVGLGAGGRRHGLDRIQPAHARHPGTDPPSVGEAACVDHLHRPRAERIGIERDDHRRLGETRQHPQRLAESELGALRGGRIRQRIVDVPDELRKALPEVGDLPQQRRRADRTCEQPQPVALGGLGTREFVGERRLEIDVGDDLAVPPHSLRPVGVVEREDMRLGEDVGRAEAGRVQRVAGDLDRPPFDGGADDAAAIAAERQGRREVERDAGDHPFGHPHVGQDLLHRLAAGRGDQRDVGGEQLERAPPREGGVVRLERRAAHRWHTEQSVRCATSMP